MIPTKIVIIGDTSRGQLFKGFAQDQLRILRRGMEFQNLNEGVRTVKPYPDVVVECWSSFSLSEINIHVLKPKVDKEELIEKFKKEKCFCGCSLSGGKIVSKIDSPCCFTFLKFPQYNVQICKYKRLYVLMEGVYASDLTLYQTEEEILVAWMPVDVGVPYANTSGCNIISKTGIETCVIVGRPANLLKWYPDESL